MELIFNFVDLNLKLNLKSFWNQEVTKKLMDDGTLPSGGFDVLPKVGFYDGL